MMAAGHLAKASREFDCLAGVGRRLLGHRAARLPHHDQRRAHLATTEATLPLG